MAKVRLALISISSLALFLSACANDGRELAEPQDWQTTTTRPPPPTSAPPQMEGDSGLLLTSPDFEPGGPVPPVARCDGDNRFPTLHWTAVDPNLDAAELAIALADQTNPEEPLLLWLMAGIDPSGTNLVSGTFPNDGAVETLNDYGQPGYGTPCLESFESGLRDLQFRIYVLPRASEIQSGDPGNEAWDTVNALAIDAASLLMQVDSTP